MTCTLPLLGETVYQRDCFLLPHRISLVGCDGNTNPLIMQVSQSDCPHILLSSRLAEHDLFDVFNVPAHSRLGSFGITTLNGA